MTGGSEYHIATWGYRHCFWLGYTTVCIRGPRQLRQGDLVCHWFDGLVGYGRLRALL